jgi:negative regulator of sigma E activity
VLHFSDRVAALNVLVGRRRDLRQPDLPASAEGAGNSVLLQRARGSIAVAIRGDAVYAVFGPVPDDTLQRIAASIP